MKIIEPNFKIVGDLNLKTGMEMLRRIEGAGRTCYKSEDKITDDSCKKFVATIMKSGHYSVIEHEIVSVRIVCDRGVTHEIVRHRIASYSQESTRYCNYSKGKYGAEISIIDPCFFKEDDQPSKRKLEILHRVCRTIEDAYMELIELGAKAQEARYILPNGTKTEIVMTANLREWRHFFKLRTSPAAHPQMREIAIPMLKEFRSLIPVIFDDIEVD